MPRKKEGIVVWGQSQEETCHYYYSVVTFGTSGRECSVTSKQALLGPSDSEQDVHTGYAWQPALGECVQVSRQTYVV